MRKLLVICGVLFCLSLTASAQDSSAVLDTASAAAEPAPQGGRSTGDPDPWQLDVGYQYQHYKVLGQNFQTQGFHLGVTRKLNDWYGVEGIAAMGFGHTGTPLNLVAKSLFLAGGPRISVFNNRRLVPWGHMLVGWQHLRFTQTTTIGNNSALGFMAGGGVDFKLKPALFWRVQGDFLGTHFSGNTIEKNYSIGTGLVLKF
jgi:hypothetical protein